MHFHNPPSAVYACKKLSPLPVHMQRNNMQSQLPENTNPVNGHYRYLLDIQE